MNIRFVTEWVGLDTIAKEEFEALRPKVEQALFGAALYYEGKVKKKLAAVPARTGRMYGSHQASAPGEPPAPWSTDLRKSITHSEVMWDGDEASVQVGSSMPYARRLELGGVDSRGIRILPRPYFSATWMEEEENIQARLDRAVKNAPILVDVSAEEVVE